MRKIFTIGLADSPMTLNFTDDISPREQFEKFPQFFQRYSISMLLIGV